MIQIRLAIIALVLCGSQAHGATLYSIADEVWSYSEDGPDCGCKPQGTDSIHVYHHSVLGGFELYNFAHVHQEAVLEIGGSLLIEEGAYVILEGILYTHGNFTNNSDDFYMDDGTLDVQGSFTNEGSIEGSGSISCQGAIKGDGTINGLPGLKNCDEATEVLPVEFVSFTAVQQDKNVLLEWVTASETNSSHYELQKSNARDGVVTFAQVAAAGNSNTDIKYSYLDTTPYIGASYYRLKQVDLDGRYMYTNILPMNTTGSHEDVYIFPNPASTEFNIVFDYAADQVDVEVYNLKGEMVYQREIRSSSFVKTYPVNFTSGTYLIKLNVDGEEFTKKFVVSK